MATVRAGGPMNIACEPGERKSHEKRVHPFLKASSLPLKIIRTIGKISFTGAQIKVD